MPERAILQLAIAQTLIWASAAYSFPALLLWWEADLEWTRAQITGAFTVALLVSAAASPVAGRIIDSGAGPQMMGLTCATAGILVGLLSFITELWQFYMIWILIGVMISGCLYEPCFALITRARGLNAKRSIVVITLVAGFASTISFPLADNLADNYGWRTAVQVFCAIAVIVASPMMYLGARSVEAQGTGAGIPATPEPVSATASILKVPQFWLLGLAFAFGALMQQITIHHLLAILESQNITRDVAVLAASFIGPMQVAGRLAMIAAERHVTNHRMAQFIFVAMAMSAIMLMFSGTATGFIAGFAILFGGAHGMVSIIRPMLAYQILGAENFGAKSGALASLFFLGGAVAPFVGSLIWRAAGYDVVNVVLVVLPIVGAVLYSFAHQLSTGQEGRD